jgi:hypothetical protein
LRRHDLKNQRESEKNSAAPPACFGENVSGLADSNERVRRRACAAEVRGEARTLSALEQHSPDEDKCVNYQENSKQIKKHCVG